MISELYYLSIKLIKPKNIVLTSMLLIFSMIILYLLTFTQSYLWVTGNVTYYLPMFLLFLYIYLIRNIFDNDFKFIKTVILLSIVLNIFIYIFI